MTNDRIYLFQIDRQLVDLVFETSNLMKSGLETELARADLRIGGEHFGGGFDDGGIPGGRLAQLQGVADLSQSSGNNRRPIEMNRRAGDGRDELLRVRSIQLALKQLSL